MSDIVERLRSSKGYDRNLNAEITVALYEDGGHEDARDNTRARLPSKSDECAPGTYWISSFSGLSLRTAPDFTSDPTLKRLALAALERNADEITSLRSQVERLREALDPFARVAAIQEPLVRMDAERWPDDRPNSDFIPSAWPVWGDFKRARAALGETP